MHIAQSHAQYACMHTRTCICLYETAYQWSLVPWLYSISTDPRRMPFPHGLLHVFRRPTGRASSSTVRNCSSTSSSCVRTLSPVVDLSYRRNLVQRLCRTSMPSLSCQSVDWLNACAGPSTDDSFNLPCIRSIR